MPANHLAPDLQMSRTAWAVGPTEPCRRCQQGAHFESHFILHLVTNNKLLFRARFPEAFFYLFFKHYHN